MCAGLYGHPVYVLNENPGFMALGAKTMCYFCGSSVFWKLAYHLSLWIHRSALWHIWSQNYGPQTENWI